MNPDLLDIFKVGGANGFTITWLQVQEVAGWNSIIQETATTLLILATLGYTIFKMIDMFRHMKWRKEDRLNQNGQ